MFYKPEHGGIWDPTVLYRNGKYYMVSMYFKDEDVRHDFMWLAQSEDGVHWKDVGAVLEDPAGICKMFLYETDTCVVADFGSFSEPSKVNNDTIRYYKSTDMEHWEFIGADHPDGTWYRTTGRWDHMYVYREKDTYYGYPVATPHPELLSAWGLSISKDGYQWEVQAPPVIEWGEVPPIDCLEGGGMEKIGDTYYYIGGFVGYAGNYGYGLYTFTADSPKGPFRPDKEAFRLCGFDRLEGRVFIQNLAAFARGKDDTLLISNAVDGGGSRQIWLLPMRKAVVDAAGHLRLGYWEGNELVKGREIPVPKEAFQLTYATLRPEAPLPERCRPTVFEPSDGKLCANVNAFYGPTVSDRHMLVTLDIPMDLTQGMVFQGILKAYSYPVYDEVRHATENWRPASMGFFVEEEGETPRGMAISLENGHPYKRYSIVETIRLEQDRMNREMIDVTGEDCATVRGIDAGKEYAFRFLYRRNMFELYVGGFLVQTFVNLGTGTGRIGFVLQNAKVECSDLKLYAMNL